MLWDGRAYCQPCVQNASPELYELAVSGGRLEETLTRDDLKFTPFMLRLAPWVFGLFLTVFGVPIISGVLFFGGDILATISGLSCFGVVICFVFVGQSYARLWAARMKHTPRTVAIEDGELTVVSPQSDHAKAPLQESRWYYGSPLADEPAAFTSMRKSVVFETPAGSIACGHTPEKCSQWKAFMELSRIPQSPPVGCLWLLLLGVAGLAGGIGVAVGIAYIAVAITGDSGWYLLIMLGIIQGPLMAITYPTCPQMHFDYARKVLHPVVVALPLAAVAFFICGGIGQSYVAGLVGALVNGSLGALFAWLCLVRIKAAHEKERESRSHLLPIVNQSNAASESD